MSSSSSTQRLGGRRAGLALNGLPFLIRCYCQPSRPAMCAMGDKNPLELTLYMRYYHLFDNIFSHPVLVLGGCPVICRWGIIIE